MQDIRQIQLGRSSTWSIRGRWRIIHNNVWVGGWMDGRSLGGWWMNDGKRERWMDGWTDTWIMNRSCRKNDAWMCHYWLGKWLNAEWTARWTNDGLLDIWWMEKRMDGVMEARCLVNMYDGRMDERMDGWLLDRAPISLSIRHSSIHLPTNRSMPLMVMGITALNGYLCSVNF